MLEIEYKILIKSPDQIIRLLKKNNFIMHTGRTHEMSTMFDNPDGLMQKTDGRIRVRKSGENVEFCYKKPITREGIKKEIEYEVIVSDYRILVDILQAMDYYETTSYERYRTEFRKGGVKATIDEYPFATYLEVEGDEQDITEEVKALGLNPGDNLTDSCDTLFQQWRKAHGLGFKPHMRFVDYNK